MSNNNQVNPQDSPILPFPVPPTAAAMGPPTSPATFYQWYSQAATMYAFQFQQQHQQQFLQQMFTTPPPSIPQQRPIAPPPPPPAAERNYGRGGFSNSRVERNRSSFSSNGDYSDRKRHFTPSSSFRDGNKRSQMSEPPFRPDQRNQPFPPSKRHRSSNEVIEDEYRE